MTTVIADSALNHNVIHSVQDLIQYFHRGEKKEGQFFVGLEHEKIGYARSKDGSFSPLPYEGKEGEPQISELFKILAARGYTPIWEQEKIIALTNRHGSITLEPGGQFEFSGSPQPSARTAVAGLDEHLKELIPLADSMGIVFMGCGFRPFGLLADVPQVPKERYRIMRQYLPLHGTLGLEMMYRTATVQANLDYSSERDALEKMRVAMSASPFVTALFAASPLKDGRPSGYQSVRAASWLDTDNTRCGLLPFVYRSDTLFADYTNWALDIPMFFVYRDHHYHAVHDFTFRQFLKEGFQNEPATLKDWEVHLSTLFPEARLRQYIEVRSADSGSLPLVKALPCFWQGLLYSSSALHAAWKLLKDFRLEELNALRSEVPKLGMRSHIRNQPISDTCRELVDIARQGLLERPSPESPAEIDLLEPLVEIARSKKTTADSILEYYAQVQGNSSLLVEKFRYR